MLQIGGVTNRFGPSRYSRYNTLWGISNIRANIAKSEFRGSPPVIRPFSAMFAGVRRSARTIVARDAAGRVLEWLGFHQGVARHASILDRDSLGTQPTGLLPVLTRCLWKHDPTAGTDHSVPGYVRSLGCDLQGKPCQSCTAGKSRGSRHRTIGGDLSPRNRTHHVPHRLQYGAFVGRRSPPRARGLRAERPEQSIESLRWRHGYGASNIEKNSSCRLSPMTCSKSSPNAARTGSATGLTCFCT